MEIIPAIDLKGGKCVRLYQGDYSREIVYSADPVAVARHWHSLGAGRLHIVDLDGAAKGEPCHADFIREIAVAVPLPIQVGGGIRRLETIDKLLQAGVQRAILGTAAVEDTELVREACQRFGEAIVISLDAREGYVATQGWRKTTAIKAVELGQKLAELGVRRLIYTDISRDGTLTAPNFEAIAELARQVRLPVIASGGISSLSHLQRLARLGLEGAIIGKALYTGDIDLRHALVALRNR